MQVFKDEVDEIIVRTRQEIAELGDKLEKYTEKTEGVIADKHRDLSILSKVAETLPERQPKLFKTPGGTERVTLQVGGREADITNLTAADQ